jgi:hypothetical protein
MKLKKADVITDLQPHQKRVVERIKSPSQSGLLVAHGLGSGKTLTSIAAQEALGLPADVVVPASLQENYAKEVRKHTTGPSPHREIKSLQNVALKGHGPSNRMLIVDEAHRAREPGSKTYQTLAKNRSEKRLLLSASPFYNHPADVAPLINLAAGGKEPVLPAKRGDFERRFVSSKVSKPGLWGSIRGVKPGETPILNPKERRHLQDTFKQWVDYHPGSTEGFPTVEREDVKVPMSPEQLKMYDTLLGKAPYWVSYKIKQGLPPNKQEAQELNAFMSAVRQVSNTTAPYQTEGKVHDPKIQAAFDRLKQNLDTNPQAKALVYSNFLDAGVKPYKQRLEESGIPYGEFTGEMARAKRDDLVRQYNENKIRALLISSAGGEGLDLKGTRLIQVLDPHWNAEKIKQVEGRGIRFKSHDHLPEEERKVLVERYLATRPRSGVMEKLRLQQPGGAADEYLAQMSANKEQLIDQFRQLMPNQPVKTASDKHRMPNATKKNIDKVVSVIPSLSAENRDKAEAFRQDVGDRALFDILHSMRRWYSGQTMDGKTKKEFAPGLPEKDKITKLPSIKEPKLWEFSAHPHQAEKAGLHIDMRLGNPETGVAHSFVVPKAEFPKPGSHVRIIPTSDHTLEYMDFTGKIPSGYGKGDVLKGRREKAEVHHANSGDEAGTKVRFNLYGSSAPEEYSIRKDKDGRWFLHNKTQTRERRPDLPSSKPTYKEIDFDKVDPDKSDQVIMPKFDGAHTIVDLQAGRSPRLFSYRPARKSYSGLIEHTHKLPKVLMTTVPKDLDGTLLRAETIAVKDGKALPAQTIGGLLNSKVLESREKQKALGAELRVIPFDVVRFKGKDSGSLSFETKREILERVQAHLPSFEAAPLARTPEDKRRLLEDIKAGRHGGTKEGVVVVDINRGTSPVGDRVSKAKLLPDHDVYIRDVHPAVDSSGKPHDRVGAVGYSWTTDGPVVGRFGGFKHDEAKDMLAHPEKYVGRVAKVRASKVFGSDTDKGALFQPRFAGWHLDKGLQ